MDVHDIEGTAARETPRRAHAGEDIERRHQFVAHGPADAVDRALIVGQILPATREVAKPVNGNALEFRVAAAAVGRGEDLDLHSSRSLPTQQLDQPGRNDVPGRARKCCDDMKNAHARVLYYSGRLTILEAHWAEHGGFGCCRRSCSPGRPSICIAWQRLNGPPSARAASPGVGCPWHSARCSS